MNRTTGVAVVLVAAALLVGCGTNQTPAAPAAATTTSAALAPTTTSETPSPTTTTTQAGPDAYVAWAKASEMGDRDMSAATDEQLLSLGNSACEVIVTQPSFGKAVEEMTKSLKSMGATAGQVEAMFRQAVINLCPQHKDMLP